MTTPSPAFEEPVPDHSHIDLTQGLGGSPDPKGPGQFVPPKVPEEPPFDPENEMFRLTFKNLRDLTIQFGRKAKVELIAVGLGFSGAIISVILDRPPETAWSFLGAGLLALLVVRIWDRLK